PAQPLDASFAPGVVGRDENFRVTAPGEADPAGRKLPTQLFVVVNLTVEYNDARPRVILHRLRAGCGQVQNGEKAMTEYNGAVRRGPNAGGVGPAVRNLVAHCDHEIGAKRARAAGVSDYSAHRVDSAAGRRLSGRPKPCLQDPADKDVSPRSM